MKTFKSKKTKKIKKIKYIIFIFFLMFSYVFIVRLLRRSMLKESILKKDVNYVNFNYKNELDKKIYDIVNNPVFFLEVPVRNSKVKKLSSNKKEENIITTNNEEKKELTVNYDNPIIYVYNTHQTEKYNNYDVYLAASNLKDQLNNSGFSTYFEENSMKTFLDNNNLKYHSSYRASKNYLTNAVNKYNSIKYFFDIHRDSVSKLHSTTTYNNKSYAKILFVVGSDNKNNQMNLNNANKLNDIIKCNVPSISRGVVMHGGKGYNGVYNQDVSDNVFLIEVGGKDNTKDEVLNTIDVLKDSIIQYIRGTI